MSIRELDRECVCIHMYTQFYSTQLFTIFLTCMHIERAVTFNIDIWKISKEKLEGNTALKAFSKL